MSTADMSPTGSAAIHSNRRGRAALDWASIHEGQVEPLYESVLDRLGAGPGMSLLDVGCGAGMFCMLASKRGAEVAGYDGYEAISELLEIARERTPAGAFRRGELGHLPYENGRFDAVTGFNTFGLASDPVGALREARRVARPGAPVTAAVWGRLEDCEGTVLIEALAPLLPESALGAPGPFALSAPGALEDVLASAGLAATRSVDVDCPWRYPDLQIALRGAISTRTATKAIEASGEDAVRRALVEAVAPYRDETGSYRFENVFRYVVARG